MESLLGMLFGILKFLFKPIIDLVSKFFFLKAYEVSTLYSSYKDAYIRPFKKLTDGIQYSINWKRYYLGKEQRTPLLLLKTENKKTFKKAVFVVNAYTERFSYQDHITVTNLSETPIRTALPSVPFRDLEIKNGSMREPYSYISVELLELFDENNKQIEHHSPPKDYLTPLDNLAVALGLEKGYVMKWGRVFNLEFIESEIKEQRIRLIGGLFMQPMWFYNLRHKLFSYNFPVKIVFWSKNLVRARQLTKAFNADISEWEKIRERMDEQKLQDSGTKKETTSKDAVSVQHKI